MTEQAGHLNAPDLVEECARALLSAHDFSEGGFYTMTEEWQNVYRDMARSQLSVLRKRGLLTIQALELLADK